MRNNPKNYRVTLELSVVVTIPVTARSSIEASSKAEHEWHDLVRALDRAGVEVPHNVILLRSASEVRS